MKPLFIVFEGLDGSGTSTQAAMLHEHISNTLQQSCHLTSEPSSGPIGQLIGSALSGRFKFTNDPKRFDRQLAYLFAADRQDHLYNDFDGVERMLGLGTHVISTRYYFSSFAYHCQSDKDLEFVTHLNSDFRTPDVTVFIGIPLEDSLVRLSRRTVLEKYENRDKLAETMRNYEKIFSNYSGRLIRVDGSLPKAEIHSKIISEIFP